jgi:hypothetical protein
LNISYICGLYQIIKKVFLYILTFHASIKTDVQYTYYYVVFWNQNFGKF